MIVENGYDMVIERYDELCQKNNDYLYSYQISSFDRSELTGSIIVLQKCFGLFLVDSFLTDVDIEHLYMMVEEEMEYLMNISLDLSPDCTMSKDILLEMIIFIQDVIDTSNECDQFEISNNMNKMMRLMIAENYHRININTKYD